jgi:hypothetical protein
VISPRFLSYLIESVPVLIGEAKEYSYPHQIVIRILAIAQVASAAAESHYYFFLGCLTSCNSMAWVNSWLCVE